MRASYLGGLLFALVVVVWLLVPGGAASGRTGSVHNREPEGRRGLRALLDELGYDTVAWSSAPGEIPGGPGVIWFASTPIPFRREGGPPAGELHDPLHYQRFLLDGGRMILPVEGAEEFLAEHLELRSFEGIEDALMPAEAATVRLAGGEPRAIEVRDASLFDPDELHEDLAGCLAVEGGGYLAAEGPVGRGRVVVVSEDAQLWANERLARADHGLIAVELLHEFDRGGPVLFDEYALGAWRAPSATRLAVGPRLIALSMGVLLWLLVATWRRVWPGPFPTDDDDLEALSPVTRARSRGALFERARRYDLAATALVAGVLGGLARRARIGRSFPDPRACLEALASRRGCSARLSAWRAELFDRPVDRPADLDHLAQVLVDIEHDLFPSESA